VNLTSAGAWRAPVHELIPVGPLQVKVRLPPGLVPKRLQMLVSREKRRAVPAGGWVSLTLRSILDHEIIVLES